jgi:hypothetical protein
LPYYERVVDSNTPLEVVVAAMPRDMDLGADLTLVKPALLYADRVRLMSPVATLLSGLASLGYAAGLERAELIAQLLETLGEPNAKQIGVMVRGMVAIDQLPRDQRRKLLGSEARELRKQLDSLDEIWAELRAKVDEVLVQAHVDELVPAVANGLVEVEPLTDGAGDDPVEQILQGFVSRIGEILAGGFAYPLFDDQMGALVQANIAQGIFSASPGTEDRGRRVSAAAELMSYLPAFPLATVGDILGVRDELKGPLVRFRSAMIDVARTLDAAPHQEEFKAEIESVYRRDVAPALLEIRQAVQDNAYLRQLLGESAKDVPKWLGAGFLAMAAAHWDQLPAIATAAAGAGAQAAWRTMADRRKIRERQFYFLYETQRLLDF